VKTNATAHRKFTSVKLLELKTVIDIYQNYAKPALNCEIHPFGLLQLRRVGEIFIGFIEYQFGHMDGPWLPKPK